MSRYPLTGKVALITGAAGGIGLGTARALHQRGAAVVLTDLDRDATESAAAAVGAERTLGLAADVTDRGALDAAVAAAIERFGRLDVVVANAGIAPRVATVRASDDAEFERVIAVDLAGVWHTARAALPEVIERRGQVVVVSSIYAFFNGMGMAPYAMAKAGVEQLGRALRRELAVHGASASVAYFGFVETAMTRDALVDPLAQRVIASAPRPLRKRLSPDAAGTAIARGIERRAPKITAPRRWALLRAGHGYSDPFEDRYVLGNKRLMAMLRQADEPGRVPSSS